SAAIKVLARWSSDASDLLEYNRVQLVSFNRHAAHHRWRVQIEVDRVELEDGLIPPKVGTTLGTGVGTPICTPTAPALVLYAVRPLETKTPQKVGFLRRAEIL